MLLSGLNAMLLAKAPAGPVGIGGAVSGVSVPAVLFTANAISVPEVALVASRKSSPGVQNTSKGMLPDVANEPIGVSTPDGVFTRKLRISPVLPDCKSEPTNRKPP